MPNGVKKPTSRQAADAGSIPAASTLGFKPKMDRNNRYIPQVIENAKSRVRRTRGRRFDCSPRLALYYNDLVRASLAAIPSRDGERSKMTSRRSE
jgi:hypothetical protein